MKRGVTGGREGPSIYREMIAMGGIAGWNAGIRGGGGAAIPLFSSVDAAVVFPVMNPSDEESPIAGDRQLAARIAGGDEEAFGDLVTLFKHRVLGTASRYARNSHELDDLGQEIFIRVWRGLGKYRGDAPLEHWVMRVAVRTCYDFLRKVRKRRECEVLVEEVLESGAEDESEKMRRSREAWEVIRAGMAALSVKDQLVLTLVELEEKSVAEAAALTGWSESNVKVRAFRARKKLKTILERSGYGNE